MSLGGTSGTVLALGLVGGALAIWAFSEKQEKRRKYPKRRRVAVYSGRGKLRHVTLPPR